MTVRLILASGSPRRQELLRQLGLSFEVWPPDVDETLRQELPLPQAVVELAARKAGMVHARAPDAVIIAADTVVVADGQVLGKPRDAAEAEAMLRLLRDRWHEVITGLVLMAPGATRRQAVITRVKMRCYSDAEIEAYVGSGDPLDKAGAYAIQHKGFNPVEQVEGPWTNVVGLPLGALYRQLTTLGVKVPALPDEFRE